MFYSDEAVNSILNYSKMMVDQINGNNDCPEKLRGLQYIVFAGMVSYYGFEHINEIYNSFAKTKFKYDNVPVIDILRKEYTLEKDLLITLDNSNPSAFYFSNVSMIGANKFKVKRDIYISDRNMEHPGEFLDDVVHEINHVVNSIIAPVIILNNSMPKIRSGLILSTFLNMSTENRYLEETINALQTEEIISHILEFSKYEIEDQEIKEVLEKFKFLLYEKKHYGGYEISKEIIRPLYEDKKFNSLLRERRLDGNLKYIKDEFNSKVSDNAFHELADVCDKMYIEPNKLDTTVFKATQLVKKYVTSNNWIS